LFIVIVYGNEYQNLYGAITSLKSLVSLGLYIFSINLYYLP